MATLSELQTELAELQAARHKLLVGSRAESIDSPAGENVKFASVTLAELNQAIAEKKREIAALDSASGQGLRPIYFDYGR